MTAIAPFDSGGPGGPGGDPAGSRTVYWIVGLSLAAAAHAGAVALALRAPHPLPPAPEPAPVVMLELAPAPAAPPSPQTYLADSLDQPEEMVEMETPPPLDTPPPVEPPPPVETPVTDALPDDPASARPAALRGGRAAAGAPARDAEGREGAGEDDEAGAEAAAIPGEQRRGAAEGRDGQGARERQRPRRLGVAGALAVAAHGPPRAAQALSERGAARGEEGVVEVRFSIDDRGNVLSAKVVRSSGHPALDEAVLDLMRRASPVPAPPPDVSRTISAPVKFAIR